MCSIYITVQLIQIIRTLLLAWVNLKLKRQILCLNYFMHAPRTEWYRFVYVHIFILFGQTTFEKPRTASLRPTSCGQPSISICKLRRRILPNLACIYALTTPLVTGRQNATSGVTLHNFVLFSTFSHSSSWIKQIDVYVCVHIFHFARTTHDLCV